MDGWYPIEYHASMNKAQHQTLSGQAATTLRHARFVAGLSLRELARRAGTSHATLRAYEHGSKTPGLDTLARILDACGFDVDLALTRRIREREGLERGAELEEVLLLAEQFPARLSRKIDYPLFPR
jgi:transcriptional regulator with XRE-family HTH domain